MVLSAVNSEVVGFSYLNHSLRRLGCIFSLTVKKKKFGTVAPIPTAPLKN